MTAFRKRVLIVDDEEDLVDMLALRLESSGLFETARAHDGAAGLERAVQWRPDAILIDGVMPGMTGWELCRRLREQTPPLSCAVVMMTAGAPEEAKKKAREHSVDGLVLKPYDQAQVIQTLADACRPRARTTQEE